MRTPLHQINGLATLVRREPLTSKQTERMEKLEKSCKQLEKIIETILDLTLLEAKQYELLNGDVSVASVLKETADYFLSESNTRQILIRLQSDSFPLTLRGDAKHIKIALQNLVDNAIRFSQADSVTIRASIADEDRVNLLVRFEVEDTGIGISPEVLPRLFNIFEQGDNSSTRQHGGLGAGLAITQKIARLMGGDAGCTSNFGKGSLFWFTTRLGKI